MIKVELQCQKSNNQIQAISLAVMKILKKIILLPLKKSQQTHLLLLRPYPSWLLLLIRRFETVCDNVKFLVLDEIEELPLLNSKWVDCFLLTVFCNPENIIESIYSLKPEAARSNSYDGKWHIWYRTQLTLTSRCKEVT